MKMQATIKASGSCGELVQGIIDDQNFLVSCPINMYNTVKVELKDDYKGIDVNINAPKTMKAVRKTLNYFHKTNLGARINIGRDLPIGKGMASSTADITAAIAGVMAALDYPLDYEIIKKIALKIEPTDGTFLPGLHLFDHINGKIQKYLGEATDLDILIFAEKGKINSVNFNQRQNIKSLKYSKEQLVSQALKFIKSGIKKNDPQLLGRGATLSSIAHQKVLYKKGLEDIIKMITKKDKVFGINIAHSGTVMGILIDKDYKSKKLVPTISAEFPQLKFISRNSMISGGLQEIGKE